LTKLAVKKNAEPAAHGKEDEVQVRTVRLRVADLGFPEGALTREIIGTDEDRNLFGQAAPFTGGRYRQLGLELCPPDLGPHLRLEYADQPRGERVYLAMKPITTSDGGPRIFVVEHTAEGLSLNAARARHDDQWSSGDLFVFCVADKASSLNDSEE
jgi:hypothetical protein